MVVLLINQRPSSVSMLKKRNDGREVLRRALPRMGGGNVGLVLMVVLMITTHCDNKALQLVKKQHPWKADY